VIGVYLGACKSQIFSLSDGCTHKLTIVSTNYYEAVLLAGAALVLHLERLEPLNQLLIDRRIGWSGLVGTHVIWSMSVQDDLECYQTEVQTSVEMELWSWKLYVLAIMVSGLSYRRGRVHGPRASPHPSQMQVECDALEGEFVLFVFSLATISPSCVAVNVISSLKLGVALSLRFSHAAC
jgi:hypothetical protein